MAGSWVAPVLVLAWGCGGLAVGVTLLLYYCYLSQLLTYLFVQLVEQQCIVGCPCQASCPH